MFTSLYIKMPEHRSRFRRFFSRFLIDTMVVRVQRINGIALKLIEYNCRSGEINWKKLDKEISAQRNRLICSKNIALPEKMGYKRFEGREYKERLCTNLALSLISALSELNLAVGLVDMEAQFTTLPKYFLEHTDSVLVVTKEVDIYTEVNEALLYEIGAPIRLSKSCSSLSCCDIIIDPKGCFENIDLKKETLVLSAKEQKSFKNATVIYDYHVELSDEYTELVPKGVSETCFAAALYTLFKEYSLGSCSPSLCVCENKVHTAASLKFLIQNIRSKNLT